MIINNIILENFKSHKKTNIKLNNGISVILGRNGAGKSTILEAISYAFFKQVNGKMDEIIRKKSEETDIIKQMKVTIKFNHNGKDYQLIRGRRGTRTIAELRELNDDMNGLYITKDSDVTREIEQIIGVDKNSYLNAIYIRQGEITALLDKTAGEKKELIGKLLNIDNLQKAYENLLPLIQEYERKLKNNEDKLKDEERDQKQKEEITNKVNELEKLFKEEETKIAETEKNFNEKSSELEELRQKEKKHLNYTTLKNNTIINIEKEEANKNRQMEELDKIEKLEEENKEIEKEVKFLDQMKQMKSLRDDYKSYEKDLKKVNEDLEKIKKQKGIIENTHENSKLYEEYKSKLEEINNEKENIYKKKQELDFINKNKEEIEKEKNDLFKSVNTIVKEASEKLHDSFRSPEEVEEKYEKDLKEYQNEKEKVTKQINENNVIISSYKTTISSTKKSLKDLEETENTCPICQSEISEDKHKELSLKYKEEIKSNQEKISKLEQDNRKYEDDINGINNSIEEVKKIDIIKLSKDYEDFESLREKLKQQKELLKDYDETISEYNKIDNKVKELNDTLNGLANDFENHRTATHILKEYDDDLLNSKFSNLNQKLDDIKNKMITLQQKFPPTDNLQQKIDYLEKREKTLHENYGKITSKNSIEENIKNIDNNLTSYNESLMNYDKELKELSFDKEYFDKIKDTCTSLTKELEVLKEEHIKKSSDIEYSKGKLEELDKQLAEYADIHKTQESLADYIKLLGIIREKYSKDGVQRTLRNQAKPLIESYTREYFEEFKFGYKDVELDEDYNITIRNNENEEINVDMLSGGEKIIIALSLRLAIARAINDSTDLLILDEPTIHLDNERRDELIEILRELNVASQILIISHDDNMENISNNIIQISKTDGISTVISNY